MKLATKLNFTLGIVVMINLFGQFSRRLDALTAFDRSTPDIAHLQELLDALKSYLASIKTIN